MLGVSWRELRPRRVVGRLRCWKRARRLSGATIARRCR